MDDDGGGARRRPGERGDAGEPRLRHLHLGLDRASPRACWSRTRNVARLFDGDRRAGSASTRSDVWTLFHSYAFDFSVWELWGALLLRRPRSSSCRYWVSRSPEAFHELLGAASGVTVLNQTPSAFRQLIAGRRRERDAAARSRCAT